MVLFTLALIKARIELALVRRIFDHVNISHGKCFVAVLLFDEFKVYGLSADKPKTSAFSEYTRSANCSKQLIVRGFRFLKLFNR